MKRIFTIMAVVAALTISTTAGAQKIGYINIKDMIGIMPEVAKIDSILQRYQADSINPQLAQIASLYQYKDSVYRDSLKTPPAVRKQIEQELPTLKYQLQNWDAIVNEALQAKEQELIMPIYNKVIAAIKQVAKEKGYTHILTKEAFFVAPDADDILLAVAAKLKVPIPKNLPAGK